METVSSSVIICPQCGGENRIPADERFFECEYCGSAIYVDKKKIVNHYVVNSNFSKEQAEGNLRRWMAGNFHVKDLDKLAKVTQAYFYYFPLWYFKTKDVSGDKVHLQPAHSTSISEIKHINIPAGNLKVFHKKDFNEKDFVNPDVLYDSAKNWLQQAGVNTEAVIESNLVHIPFYQFYYEFKGNQYTAIVEASSGKAYANIWPAKSEAPFKILFGISILVFLFISFISGIIAFMINDDYEVALISYEMIKFAGYIAASVPLVIIAYFVAKKV